MELFVANFLQLFTVDLDLFLLVLLRFQSEFELLFKDLLVSLVDVLHCDSLVGPKVQDGNIHQLPHCPSQGDVLTTNHVLLGILGPYQGLNTLFGGCAEGVSTPDHLLLLRFL